MSTPVGGVARAAGPCHSLSSGPSCSTSATLMPSVMKGQKLVLKDVFRQVEKSTKTRSIVMTATLPPRSM